MGLKLSWPQTANKKIKKEKRQRIEFSEPLPENSIQNILNKTPIEFYLKALKGLIPSTFGSSFGIFGNAILKEVRMFNTIQDLIHPL